MKNVILSLAFTVLSLTAVTAQTKSSSLIPSNLDINNALKQALEISTGKSSDQLSAVDGFFGNAAIKILFPPEAQKAEKTLRAIGLNKLCDDVILSLNRAAEGAAKEAKPIFVDAIKQMTLTDVSNILLGDSTAATQYFKRTTTLQLSAKFRPIIEGSLGKTGATRYYTSAATSYNKVPFVKKINPDITDYVTQKAIDGLFLQIAKEELNIRTSLSARSTPLLKKVFSFADSFKK